MAGGVIRFEVAGEPVGKGRPRATIRAGHACVYTPKETENVEAFVKSEALRQIGRIPLLEGPLVLSVTAIRSIPKSFSKKKREAALARMEFPDTKPDLDNIAKLYADALNGILWRDDSQIVEMWLSKFYGNEPKTIIAVRRRAS